MFGMGEEGVCYHAVPFLLPSPPHSGVNNLLTFAACERSGLNMAWSDVSTGVARKKVDFAILMFLIPVTKTTADSLVNLLKHWKVRFLSRRTPGGGGLPYETDGDARRLA